MPTCRLTTLSYGRAQLFQYYSESIGLKWEGGDAESGIADYEVAGVEYVSPDGLSDDNGALMMPESTHRQNYFHSVRVGAIGDAPHMYYRIRAVNKYAIILATSGANPNAEPRRFHTCTLARFWSTPTHPCR